MTGSTDRHAGTFRQKAVTGTASTTDYEEYGYDASDNRTSLREARWYSVVAYQFDALNRNIG